MISISCNISDNFLVRPKFLTGLLNSESAFKYGSDVIVESAK